jgi:hypothetical protein
MAHVEVSSIIAGFAGYRVNIDSEYMGYMDGSEIGII